MNIIVGSKFKPFSYEELTAPLRDYTEAYNKVEEDYSNLVALTEMWKNIANLENNPEAYALYKSFDDELNAVVDDFRKGMTIGNRRAGLGLKRGYNRNIVPIAQADAARKEAMKYRDTVRASDNSAIFEKNDLSLDDFLHGKTVSNSYVSGKDVMARVATAAQAFSKLLSDNPEKLRKLVGGDYYKTITEYGFNSDAILAAIAQSPNAAPELTQLVNDAIDSSGVKGWNGVTDSEGNYTRRGQSLVNLLRSYANQGLWQAVGTALTQILNNWRALENLSHSHAMARQTQAQQFEQDQRQRDAENAQELQRLKNEGKLNSGSGGAGYRGQIVPTFIKDDGANGHVVQIRDGNNITADYGKPVVYDNLTPSEKDQVRKYIAPQLGKNPDTLTSSDIYNARISLIRGEYDDKKGILILQAKAVKDATTGDAVTGSDDIDNDAL